MIDDSLPHPKYLKQCRPTATAIATNRVPEDYISWAYVADFLTKTPSLKKLVSTPPPPTPLPSFPPFLLFKYSLLLKVTPTCALSSP